MMMKEATGRPNNPSTGASIPLGVIAFLLAFDSASRHAGAEPPPSTGTVDKSFSFFEPVKPPRQIQVMAHRGLSRLAPENTAPAIERCIADGLEWAEVDVRLTKDGVPVLAHDSALDGRTDGRGNLSEQTLEQLQSLDAGSWFARRYSGTRILTLNQALKLAKGRINLYLDCKRVDAKSLVHAILEAGMERQVIVYADPATLATVREASRSRVPILAKWHPAFGLTPWVEQIQPTAVEIDAEEVTAEACRAFHKRGIKVQAQTLGAQRDRPDVWSRVIASGVDWIQTDLPEEVLLQSLRSRHAVMPVKIAFHRGASRYAPENTLPAIEKAIALGADYVEIDIRTSQDGRFFLQHDARLERTTSGKGLVNTHPGEALALLDAGSWFGRPFAGIRVPTLDQALDALSGHSDVYLDAKNIAPEALVAMVEKHGMLDRAVVYQGPAYLKRLKGLNPKIRLLPALRDPARLNELAEQLQPYGVDAAWSILSKEFIDRCHARGIRVFSDAIGLHETLKDYARAMDWGIDVIQTDHPARVLRAIELRQDLPRAGN